MPRKRTAFADFAINPAAGLDYGQSGRREWELTAGNADCPVSPRRVSHSTGQLIAP